MTNQEFDQWLEYHTEAFPSLTTWLADNSGSLAHWRRALADVSLDGAKAATDAMFGGDMNKPQGWSNHPAAIRDWGRDVDFGIQRQPRVLIDGTETFRCHLCKDTGTVTIWWARTMQAIKENLEAGGNGAESEIAATERRTGAVACACDEGYRFREMDSPKHIQTETGKLFLVYRESCMVRVDEGWDVLVDHVAKATPMMPDNFSPTLAAFNNEGEF